MRSELSRGQTSIIFSLVGKVRIWRVHPSMTNSAISGALASTPSKGMLPNVSIDDYLLTEISRVGLLVLHPATQPIRHCLTDPTLRARSNSEAVIAWTACSYLPLGKFLTETQNMKFAQSLIVEPDFGELVLFENQFLQDAEILRQHQPLQLASTYFSDGILILRYLSCKGGCVLEKSSSGSLLPLRFRVCRLSSFHVSISTYFSKLFPTVIPTST